MVSERVAVLAFEATHAVQRGPQRPYRRLLQYWRCYVRAHAPLEHRLEQSTLEQSVLNVLEIA